jgi:hypothetical protein
LDENVALKKDQFARISLVHVVEHPLKRNKRSAEPTISGMSPFKRSKSLLVTSSNDFNRQSSTMFVVDHHSARPAVVVDSIRRFVKRPRLSVSAPTTALASIKPRKQDFSSKDVLDAVDSGQAIVLASKRITNQHYFRVRYYPFSYV